MERSGIGCQCGGAPTTPRLPGVVGVRPRPDTEGAQTKPAPAMNEHKQTTHQDPLINLLFDDGLKNALPRIAEILMNAAMLLERETHIGAAPYQRGMDRNGYANGFKPRSFQTGIGALELSVPQVRESDRPFRASMPRGFWHSPGRSTVRVPRPSKSAPATGLTRSWSPASRSLRMRFPQWVKGASLPPLPTE